MIKNVDLKIYMLFPTGFSPNGDAINNTFYPILRGIQKIDELKLYNRWGELIWESHDIEVGWDGTYGGKYAEQGTYTWVIRTKDLMNDAKYTYEGHINLLK